MQKKYDKESDIYSVKKENSFRVAKRNIIMAEVVCIAGINLFVALALFLLLIIGTSAMPYFVNINIEFTPENFSLRGGCFTTICGVFLIIFSITAMWYAVSYKRLEIMCMHLDGGLEGAAEVDEAARWDSCVSHEGFYGANYTSLGGPAAVSYNYLNSNGIKTVNPMIFKIIKVVLIIAQIILAGVCLLILVNS